MSRFNKRDTLAFSEVYALLYDDLYYYTKKIIEGVQDIKPGDIIHDVFVKLWSSDKNKFNNINSLRGYFFVSIKNEFRNYLSRAKYAEAYKNQIMERCEDRIFTSMAETEFLSIVSQAIDILPPESSKVIKLYLEGFSIKEIAEKLGKSTSTIYSQREEAIKTLKKKFNNELNEFYVLLLAISKTLQI